MCRVHPIRSIDLNIRKGEFVAIIGASGSGKSMLFHVLGGLTPATSGNVRITGRDLADMTNAERIDLRKAAVGFVFQKYNLLPTLSAEGNIRIVQYIAGRATAFDPAFQAVFRLLRIADRMKHKPRSLSGGQQQRVAIARGIVNSPAILLGRRAHWKSRQRELGYGSEADEGPKPSPGTDDPDDHTRFRRGCLCRQDCKNARWVYRLEAQLFTEPTGPFLCQCAS